MGEVIHVSFIMTILILSSFIIWEITSKDPYDDQSGDDPISILRPLKEKNADRPVIAHLNINFIALKFEVVNSYIKDNIDILLMISETKIDNTLPTEQVKIEGYSRPIRLDRTWNSVFCA